MAKRKNLGLQSCSTMRKPVRGVIGGGVGALAGLAVGLGTYWIASSHDRALQAQAGVKPVFNFRTGLGLTAATLIGGGVGAAIGAKRPDC